MEDYRQSEEYCQHFFKHGWVLEKVGCTNVLIKKIFCLGSIIKIQRGSADTSLIEIEKLAKKNKAMLVIFEPYIKVGDAHYIELEGALKLSGYSNGLNIFLSPTKTSYIDLTKSEESILSSFDQDICKSIKRNLENKISFRVADSVEEFYPLLHEAGYRRNYFVQSLSGWRAKWQPFNRQLKIILAYSDRKLLGGNMFIIEPPIAFGLFLPTTEYGRDNGIAASLVWEGFKLAKKSGCDIFDLDGLYDERYDFPRKWLGLTAFKRKFRGQEVEFMHPKVKVYAWYLKPLEKLGLLWMFFVDI